MPAESAAPPPLPSARAGAESPLATERRERERDTFRRMIADGVASGISGRRAEVTLAEARRRAWLRAV